VKAVIPFLLESLESILKPQIEKLVRQLHHQGTLMVEHEGRKLVVEAREGRCFWREEPSGWKGHCECSLISEVILVFLAHSRIVEIVSWR